MQAATLLSTIAKNKGSQTVKINLPDYLFPPEKLFLQAENAEKFW